MHGSLGYCPATQGAAENVDYQEGEALPDTTPDRVISLEQKLHAIPPPHASLLPSYPEGESRRRSAIRRAWHRRHMDPTGVECGPL